MSYHQTHQDRTSASLFHTAQTSSLLLLLLPPPPPPPPPTILFYYSTSTPSPPLSISTSCAAHSIDQHQTPFQYPSPAHPRLPRNARLLFTTKSLFDRPQTPLSGHARQLLRGESAHHIHEIEITLLLGLDTESHTSQISSTVTVQVPLRTITRLSYSLHRDLF